MIPTIEIKIHSKVEADTFVISIKNRIKDGTRFYTNKGIPLENETEVIAALL